MSFAACDSMNLLGKEKTWRPGIDFNLLALEWELFIILDVFFFPFWVMFLFCKTCEEGEFLFSCRAFPGIPTYYIYQLTCRVCFKFWKFVLLFKLLLFKEKISGRVNTWGEISWNVAALLSWLWEGEEWKCGSSFVPADPIFGKSWIYPNPLILIISKLLCLNLKRFWSKCCHLK